jgi:hypothetical protein
MALAIFLANREFAGWMPGDTLVAQLVRLSGTIALGLVAVALSARTLRISEFDALVDQVRGQLQSRLPQ